MAKIKCEDAFTQLDKLNIRKARKLLVAGQEVPVINPDYYGNCQEATFIDSANFSLVGDQREIYQVGREIQIDSGQSNVNCNTPIEDLTPDDVLTANKFDYSIITNVSYDEVNTTVTITDDILTDDLEEVCVYIGWPSNLTDGIIDLTLSEAQNSDSLAVGDVINISDRLDGLFDVVLTSTVTPNDMNIIQSISNPDLSFVMRVNSHSDVTFGVIGDWNGSTGTDNTETLLSYLRYCVAGDLTPVIKSTDVYLKDFQWVWQNELGQSTPPGPLGGFAIKGQGVNETKWYIDNDDLNGAFMAAGDRNSNPSAAQIANVGLIDLSLFYVGASQSEDCVTMDLLESETDSYFTNSTFQRLYIQDFRRPLRIHSFQSTVKQVTARRCTTGVIVKRGTSLDLGVCYALGCTWGHFLGSDLDPNTLQPTASNNEFLGYTNASNLACDGASEIPYVIGNIEEVSVDGISAETGSFEYFIRFLGISSSLWSLDLRSMSLVREGQETSDFTSLIKLDSVSSGSRNISIEGSVFLDADKPLIDSDDADYSSHTAINFDNLKSNIRLTALNTDSQCSSINSELDVGVNDKDGIGRKSKFNYRQFQDMQAFNFITSIEQTDAVNGEKLIIEVCSGNLYTGCCGVIDIFPMVDQNSGIPANQQRAQSMDIGSIYFSIGYGTLSGFINSFTSEKIGSRLTNTTLTPVNDGDTPNRIRLELEIANTTGLLEPYMIKCNITKNNREDGSGFEVGHWYIEPI